MIILKKSNMTTATFINIVIIIIIIPKAYQKLDIKMENCVTINPGSKLKQNCREKN